MTRAIKTPSERAGTTVGSGANDLRSADKATEAGMERWLFAWRGAQGVAQFMGHEFDRHGEEREGALWARPHPTPGAAASAPGGAKHQCGALA